MLRHNTQRKLSGVYKAVAARCYNCNCVFDKSLEIEFVNALYAPRWNDGLLALHCGCTIRRQIKRG